MLGAPVTTVPPTGELFTIEVAKGFLRIDGSVLDAEVGMLRDAAIEDVQQLTGLRLLSQTVEVRADCFADLSHLRVGPVASVEGISYLDLAGGAHDLTAESYSLRGAPLEQAIVATSTFPEAKAGSIVATLNVGYGADAVDVPAPLRLAVFAKLRGNFDGEDVDLGALTHAYRFWL